MLKFSAMFFEKLQIVPNMFFFVHLLGNEL